MSTRVSLLQPFSSPSIAWPRNLRRVGWDQSNHTRAGEECDAGFPASAPISRIMGGQAIRAAKKMVGVAGFEPATPSSRTSVAT
jgi:hypothetical protein